MYTAAGISHQRVLCRVCGIRRVFVGVMHALLW